jgi:hypothetical protein
MPSQGGRKVTRGITACKEEKGGFEQNSEPRRSNFSKSQEHLLPGSQTLPRQ